MALDLDRMFEQAVVVDEAVAKEALAGSPSREGGGWVKPLIQKFDADQRDNLFLPVSAFPAPSEKNTKTDAERAKGFAQNIRTQARDSVRVDVNAKALTVDEALSAETGLPVGTVGVMLTHEYPTKSNRGRQKKDDSDTA